MGSCAGVHAASIVTTEEYYHTSQLASTSALSFFLLGFAKGPASVRDVGEEFYHQSNAAFVCYLHHRMCADTQNTDFVGVSIHCGPARCTHRFALVFSSFTYVHRTILVTNVAGSPVP